MWRRWRPDIVAALPGWIVARFLVATARIASHALASQAHVAVGRRTTGLLAWDAGWYAAIARHGYDALPREGLRFFPLFPLLARVLAVPLGGRTDLAVILLANACALLLGALVHRLVSRETGDAPLARRAAWLVALLPPSYVLVLGYSEALAGVLAVGVFLCIRRRRWLPAAALGVLAGLTRPVGVLLVVPVSIAAVMRVTESSWGERLQRLVAVCAPALGCGAYLWWVQREYGDALLPLRIQATGRLRGDVTSPVQSLWRSAQAALDGHLGDAMHLPWALLAVALVIVAVRRWPPPYGGHAAITWLATYSAASLDSAERYVFGSVALVLAAAGLLRRPVTLVLAASGVVMTIYATAAFLNRVVP
ncbi:MAG: mannosyltransferase family protein [Mycobacteriales bacterium]|nr:hypothetical protein [Frankia sp.]